MKAAPGIVAPGDVPFVVDGTQGEPPEHVLAAACAWTAAATARGLPLKALGDLTGIPPARVVSILGGSVAASRTEAGAIDFVLQTSEAPGCHPPRSASVPQRAPTIVPKHPAPSVADETVADEDGRRAAKWRDLMRTETRMPTSIARGTGMSHARLRKLLAGVTPTESEVAALDAYLGFGRRTVVERTEWLDAIKSVNLNVADVVRRARLDPARGRKIIAGSAMATESERLALVRAIERKRARLA